MNKFILFLLLNGLGSPLCGQVNAGEAAYVIPDDTTVYNYVEVRPQFSGSLAMYLKKNKHYPQKELEEGVEGLINVSFVVEKDGSLSNIKASNASPCGPGLTTEAIRLIREMPAWIPGKQDGHTVRVRSVIPVVFLIGYEDDPVSCGRDLGPYERTTICSCNPGKLPQFPGGNDSLEQYFKGQMNLTEEEIKNYSDTPITFSFVIDTSGAVFNVHVQASQEKAAAVQQSVAEAICTMPRWIPGSGEFVKLRVEMKGSLHFHSGGNVISLLFEPVSLVPYESKFEIQPWKQYAYDTAHPVMAPFFVGGDKALHNYFRQNMIYPQTEKQNGIEGSITISFIVERDGSVNYVSAKTEVPGAPGFTEEAIRLVQQMPGWEPGKINGHLARIPMEVNVDFKLQ